MPIFIPLQRRLDLDGEVNRFSVFTRLEGCVAVAALSPIAPGKGRAVVDGAALSQWDAVPLRGNVHLLLLPLAEAARDYGRRYRVVLEGFETPSGKRFPRLSFAVTTAPRREPDPAFADHDAAALEAAREGMVLLVNDGALPLPGDARLNCLGGAQHYWRTSMGGASRINPRWRPSFHQAVEEHSSFQVNRELSDLYLDLQNPVPGPEMLRRARAFSDVALVFIGRHSAEMMDSRDAPGEYRLSEDELSLLRAARAAFPRLVVILNAGGPLDMTWLEEIAPNALLFTGLAGMLSACAAVEILDGRTNPSGHLPDTWPWRWADNPVSRNYPALPGGAPYVPEDAVGVRVYYEEDVYLGYRYFDTFGVPVAFPFGHGMSYTKFEMEPASLRREGNHIAVRVAVRNAGARAGKAVVQVYVSLPAGRLEKPARVLAGFDKTELLAPGESQALEISLRLADVASFDEARAEWVLEAGRYDVAAGFSLAETVPLGSLGLEETVLRKVEHLGCPVEDFKRLTREDPTVDGSRSKIVKLGEQIAVRKGNREQATGNRGWERGNREQGTGNRGWERGNREQETGNRDSGCREPQKPDATLRREDVRHRNEQVLRFAQDDTSAPRCHPERSEGPVGSDPSDAPAGRGDSIAVCAQDDTSAPRCHSERSEGPVGSDPSDAPAGRGDSIADCAQDDASAPRCHPERSEGPVGSDSSDAPAGRGDSIADDIPRNENKDHTMAPAGAASRPKSALQSLPLLTLCRLNVCAGMRWLPGQDGMAGYAPRFRRLNLPAMNVSDANAGLNLAAPNVGFPASSVVAASFNRGIAETVGRVVAAECPAHGVDLVLGPGMNLHRGALCGRNPEYFSEDPLLAGELAGHHARGLESAGVGSCYKHLFCNNAELGRLGSHSVVSEQALRELYFRAFEIAFRVQRPRSVMTAYNALNGLYTAENPELLRGLLRGEWGFTGLVMSDWSSARTVSAVNMVNAGNGWIAPGGPLWLWRVYRAARRGEIEREALEENARWRVER